MATSKKKIAKKPVRQKPGPKPGSGGLSMRNAAVVGRVTFHAGCLAGMYELGDDGALETLASTEVLKRQLLLLWNALVDMHAVEQNEPLGPEIDPMRVYRYRHPDDPARERKMPRCKCARCGFSGRVPVEGPFDGVPVGWVEVSFPPSGESEFEARIYCDRCSVEIRRFLEHAPDRATSDGDVFTYEGALTILNVDAGPHSENFPAAVVELTEASTSFVTWATKRLPLEAKKKLREESAAFTAAIASGEGAVQERMREMESTIMDAAKLPDLRVVKSEP